MEHRVGVVLESMEMLDGQTRRETFRGTGLLTVTADQIGLQYTVQTAQGEPHSARLRLWPGERRAAVRRSEGLMELDCRRETQVVLARVAGCTLRGIARTEEVACQSAQGRPDSLHLRYALRTENGVALGQRSLTLTLQWDEN